MILSQASNPITIVIGMMKVQRLMTDVGDKFIIA